MSNDTQENGGSEFSLPPVVQFSEEISTFIEHSGHSMNGIWCNNPFWYQKFGKNQWRGFLFNKLPEEVQKDLQPLMPINKIANDKSFNMGIDAAINLIDDYHLDNPSTWASGHFDIITKKLTQLKKKIQ